TIRFISTLNTSYISGGFIKATYTTDTLIENISTGYYRYTFPSVEGFINIYDGVPVPGIITGWTLNLTYDSIYATFMNLANETVFIDPGQNTTRSIYITRSNLSIPPSTLPIRMTHTNLTNITILDQGQPSDSFLITDVSGSMSECAVYENQTVCRYEYKQAGWWWFWLTTSCTYNNVSCGSNECGINPINATRNYAVVNQSVCTKTLMDVAKEADNLFVDTVLNASTLHRIGLVDFSTDANPPTNLTNVEAVLTSEINTYTPSGSTCTCCGINRARNMLINSTNKKFMVVLSDGEPTHNCSNLNDYTGTSSSTTSASNAAINASRTACLNNITVYSIGFGASMSSAGHAVMKNISCNASLYYNATNVTQLANIYAEITQQILLSANFSSQTVNILGSFNKTALREGYLDVYYTDVNSIDIQNKISLVIESEQFNSCTKSVKIPGGITIRDAQVTSYSSNYWTTRVKVNNNTIYNLSSYNKSYDLLGDPFIIQVPSLLLNTGQNNTIELVVGDQTNSSNCSNNNTLIYTALINVSTTRTDALEKKVGCDWKVQSAGGMMDLSIPSDYSGNKTCYYNSTLIYYDDEDVYDVSVYNMLKQLDYESSGTIFFDLTQNDLEILLITTGQVAYMWGPSLVNIEVWK
ncbi:MAG TPA: vWA domain-containing protein, partial [Alphaproteobacteria bacterium]|nr:vWA domain-containing protein [Alphaproteobacteria bacterium]